MNRIEKLLQWLVIGTVLLASLLLGMGQNDFEPLLVAVFGAVAAWVMVDKLQWFYLPQWLANLLAVIVTIITVTNFYFTADTVRHLLGVGKLLVYLQSILLFQRKSARVYWQVLVLTLLQIVVGAVFNLGFEGGVLFILYMMVAGLTMMVLHLYHDRQALRDHDRETNRRQASVEAKLANRTRPIVVSLDNAFDRGVMRRMVGSFTSLGFGALVFALLLFYFLPRENSSWSGPQEAPMKATGAEQKVSMEHSDIVLLSSKLRMNVRYWRSGGTEAFSPPEMPYLRGMSLSNLKTVGNKTEWIPPPFQVRNDDFRTIPSATPRSFVVQEIVLEPTDDPLLFSALPAKLRADESSSEFEWCWPLGAMTRQGSGEKISVTHFRYSLNLPILPDGTFYKSFPYASRSGRIPLTPEQDNGNYQWLTYLNKDRYPKLVEQSDQLAANVPDGNHLIIAQSMERWLQDTNRFKYTLDFRDVVRDPSLDTIEDFVANHRAGYCEYFASALALMLRSQGIPARMVTGFRGGDLNEFGKHLDVEQRHGHAWVEAYIRPEFCTQEMTRSGQADQNLGAWLRLDPTPAVDQSEDMLAGADDALGYAKSLWRDYVLGLQAERGATTVTDGSFKMAGMLRFLDLGYWQEQASSFDELIEERGGKKVLAIAAAGLAVVLMSIFFWFKARNRKKNSSRYGSHSQAKARQGWFRRQVVGLLTAVSPALGEWVNRQAADDVEVEFYSRMLKTLSKAGFERQASQTQLEFATDVGQRVQSIDQLQPVANDVNSIVKQLTAMFYRVRFGKQSLSEQQSSEVNTSLDKLKTSLGGYHEKPASEKALNER